MYIWLLSFLILLIQIDSHKYKLDPIDYGRRVAIERNVTQSLNQNIYAVSSSVVFDASSNFIIYPTILGIKSMFFSLQ